MKRIFEIANDEIEGTEGQSSKVMLVEREAPPFGTALVNIVAVGKKSYIEQMELAESISNVNTFATANGRNHVDVDVIGRQVTLMPIKKAVAIYTPTYIKIQNLQELVMEVVEETQTNSELLDDVACNFVKKPGHTYHLYKRPSGQKYFSMLSPEEWGSAPHKFLGSWRLDTDYSWTEADRFKFEGLTF